MNVAILGYGKMGHEIEAILNSRGHQVTLIIDRDNAHDLNDAKLQKCDVAIEFSTPDTAFANITACLNAGTPVVCGTTAWLDKLPEAQALCAQKQGAFFYASNYSVGVNLFFKVSKFLAGLMNRVGGYDVTLREVHHTQKKDAPSGTAITLAEDLVAELDVKTAWHLGTTTDPALLEVTAQRRSVVPGIHEVVWESPVDVITMEHSAKGRTGFALGAVLAAEFIVGKQGVFTMDDLLAF